MERTPGSIAELRDITAEMPFNETQDYLDGLPDETVIILQDEARSISPTFPTYEDYKKSHRRDFGKSTCFVGNCRLPALYPVEQYGMCERHAGIKRHYLFDLLFETKPKTPKTLIYGGPFGNAPV